MPSFGIADAVLVLAYAGALVIPGLVLGLAAGLRRWTAAAASPAMTYGLTAVAGQICTLLNIDFEPVAFLTAAVITTGIVLIFRLFVVRLSKGSDSNRPEGDSGAADSLNERRSNVLIVVGILAGTLLSAGTVLTAMGRIDAINQRWDAVFHSSATAFILNTKNADPGALKEVLGSDSAFYPNLYHSLGALVGQLTGAPVPALLGAQLMLVCGVAALGLAALVRAQSRRVALAALSPFLLAMFSGFPYDILLWGPVWAYAAGIALVPGFLLLFKDSLEHRTAPTVFVSGVAAAGVLGTHVAAALTAAVFVVAFLAFRWWPRRTMIRRDLVTAGAALLVASIVAPVYVVGSFISRANVYETPFDWPPVASPGAATGNLLSLSQDAPYPQYWLVALLIVGALAIKSLRAMWWWFGVTGVFVVLYVGAAAYNSPITEALTLPWWNDRFRLAAVANIGFVVLAAHGLVTIGERLVVAARSRTSRVRRLSPRHALATALILLLIALGVLSNGFYAARNSDHLAGAFAPAPTVTVEEQAAMQVLAGMVGPGKRVMNDPNDGSTWMWPIAGVRPVIGQIVYGYGYDQLSSDTRLLLESFRCVDSDPEVRDVLSEQNVTHLFLGSGFITEAFGRIEGLRNLNNVNSLKLVYAEDNIRIYEIDLAPLDADPRGDCDSSST